jgi:predicted nucleic acid-binding protein
MARDYRPKSSRLAIDANVLSLLLVYNHCVCTNISVQRRERILVETRGRDDGLPTERFNDLWQVFCSVARRMVTQHIIAETLNCRRGWLRDNREAARSSAVSLVQEFAMEGRPCRIVDLAANAAYLKALIELGPADAGLLYVAESIGATLISDDGPLLQWAYSHGVPAYPVSGIHLLA